MTLEKLFLRDGSTVEKSVSRFLLPKMNSQTRKSVNAARTTSVGSILGSVLPNTHPVVKLPTRKFRSVFDNWILENEKKKLGETNLEVGEVEKTNV